MTAAIFHDLAKVQPVLKPGDLVNPREVFEPGHLHAFRSAALAEGIYRLGPEAVLLIEFHHHVEEELPAEFPPHLLPMYRFFRLIDGLSAAMTRRGAKVKITVDGSKVHVLENNPAPTYNRSLTLDLYTGKTSLHRSSHARLC
ncbi:HD domain-containing protein [Ammonifex degensii]|uniref:HD domain-containing protein n=1 Tax=Ammonifex degensii TaxID=42838 RepID=UPI001FDF7DC3|nr:HD domain-containing protein [Ammonifex degensii]